MSSDLCGVVLDGLRAELGSAELIVRKNKVVWTLMLHRTGSTGSNANEIRKDEVTAELKKYAAILKARVGSG